MNSKRVLYLALFTLGVISFLSQPTVHAANYSNYNHNFKLVLPDNWVFKQVDDQQLVLIGARENNPNNGTLALQISETLGNVALNLNDAPQDVLENFHKTAVKRVKENKDKYEFLSSKITTLGDNKVILVTYREKQAKVDCVTATYLINSKLYLFYCEAPVDKSAKAFPEFFMILESFKQLY